MGPKNDMKPPGCEANRFGLKEIPATIFFFLGGGKFSSLMNLFAGAILEGRGVNS